MVKVENIKVAVRVRPFNSRELAKHCKSTVSMLERTTMLLDHITSNRPSRTFKFDHSYWSHDGFKVNDEGYFEPEIQKYVDQKRMFDDLGAGLIENAWSGYNCTLFAYGQTGSGKTYTMAGTKANKGLIPMTGQRLFKEIEMKGKKPGVIYQVSISMMEIYNEKVRDLLDKGREEPKHGLPVRQSPHLGFYVEGLSAFPVAGFKDIAYYIEEGNKNRTLAATRMNETSSRAHTIVIIGFVQNYIRENKTKQSKIFMVDLAGSERAAQTGATGIRFEESKNINKSLMTLGTVIKNLCAKATGRTDQGPSPYRDSKLTMLLKDSIGGNSKTVMVATISPSDEDYEQTLSTLRYADRVKSIKNTAKMNVADTDKLIKDLLAEKEALLQNMRGKPDSRLGYTEEEIQRLRNEQMKEIEQIKSEMQNVEEAWQRRLMDTKLQMEQRIEEERKEQKERQSFPHLYNLNEDMALTGKVYYLIKEGQQLTIGNRRADIKPSLELHGPSIAKEHAFFNNRRSVITVHPLQGQVRVNGTEVVMETILKHQDRIFFGSNNFFVFHHPLEEERLIKAGKHTLNITYEFAQNEIGTNAKVTLYNADQDWLRQEVAETLVRTQDANAMAVVLDRDVVFEPIVIANLVLGNEQNRSQVYVRVQSSNGGEFIWGKNHFLDRYDLMLDMFQKYEIGDPSWQPKTKTQDPFWEPLETPTLVGVAYLPLESIAYMLNIEDQKIGIYDYQASHVGYLTVALVPCNSQEVECSDDQAVEEPIDLLGTDITFKLKIRGATGIPKRFKSSWCHYSFYTNQTRYYTDEVMGAVPKYKYARAHSLTKINHNMVHYLENKSIMIEIHGRQKSGLDMRRGSAMNSYTMADSRRYSEVPPSRGSGGSRTSISETSVPEVDYQVTENIDKSSFSAFTSITENDEDTMTTETGLSTPTHDDLDVSDKDFIEDLNDSQKTMDELRKGISSIMESVIQRESPQTDVDMYEHQTDIMAMSEVAANTAIHTMKDALHYNATELQDNQSKLMSANRKMSQIQRLVAHKKDKTSKEIRNILDDLQLL